MIPEHRLITLLDQVKQTQINNCLYHNTSASPSLYSYHMCDRAQFPLKVVLELNQHSDEVWYLDFSHDGSKLITTSRDRTAIIYETSNFTVLQKLTDHQGAVAHAVWSPDDSKIITCSHDQKARVYNATNGDLLMEIDHHHEPVTCASWAPDGNSFVTGSLDRKSQLCLWGNSEDPLHTWSGDYRVQDCAISPDGHRLVTISTDKKIFVYNFVTREEVYNVTLKHDLTCITISQDSKYMLVNMSNNEIQLLDIETANLVRSFQGQRQGQYVIRSNFGGAAENFIISGSEGLSFSTLPSTKLPLLTCTPIQIPESTFGTKTPELLSKHSKATQTDASTP